MNPSPVRRSSPPNCWEANDMFDRIKAWHAEGLWTDVQVAKARDKGWITAEQYAEIMGQAGV